MPRWRSSLSERLKPRWRRFSICGLVATAAWSGGLNMHGDSDADRLCWVGVYAMPIALLAADLVWSRVQPRWWHLAASGGIFLAFLCAFLALAFLAPLT